MSPHSSDLIANIYNCMPKGLMQIFQHFLYTLKYIRKILIDDHTNNWGAGGVALLTLPRRRVGSFLAGIPIRCLLSYKQLRVLQTVARSICPVQGDGRVSGTAETVYCYGQFEPLITNDLSIGSYISSS